MELNNKVENFYNKHRSNIILASHTQRSLESILRDLFQEMYELGYADGRKPTTRIEEATNKIIKFIDIVKDVPKNESILAIGLDMVEWADRTMLDKTCRWLLEHGQTQHVIDRYRKDMEE